MDTPDKTHETPFSQVSKRRREIFERTQAKYAATGIVLDDPAYLDLIGLWIGGEMTMPAAAARWDKIRNDRRDKQMRPADDVEQVDSPKMSQEDLLLEIAQLRGSDN